MEIVFDTYAWIEYFQGTKKGEVVAKYLEEHEIITPIIVLLELSYISEKEKWNIKDCLKFIKHNSEIVGINEEFILSFGKFYTKTKKKLEKIGITDIIIMHTAVLNDAKILTGDKHFKNTGREIML